MSPTEYKGGGGGGLKRVDCHLTAFEGAGDYGKFYRDKNKLLPPLPHTPGDK